MNEREPQMLVVGRPGRGRPRQMAEPGVSLMVWVPQSVHRELTRRAAQDPIKSISAVARDVLQKATTR